MFIERSLVSGDDERDVLDYIYLSYDSLDAEDFVAYSIE